MPSFTGSSFERTEAALKTAALKLEVAAPLASKASAEVVASKMRDRAPVLTGRLRASIHVEGSHVVADAPYAIPVDRGTVNQKAQPFAEDAADASHEEIVAAMTAVFRTALGGR